ncbi:GFA family protein [Hydrogenophaga palleronii]|uniref:GFA family protein n=1 Tax=Hydrogenophaga palleronii TaxID=65655 RepID=UPI000826D6F2|nr:GFA family protein [Hydrogenophaga palleronii]
MTAVLHRGSCLCGGVRYELTADIQAVTHCHCSQCRKAHAAAFGSYGSVRRPNHVFTQGVDLLRHYRSSAHVTRSFCSVCGSAMAWQQSEGAYTDWVSIPLGTLDTPLVPRKQRHVHTDTRAPWHAAQADEAPGQS